MLPRILLQMAVATATWDKTASWIQTLVTSRKEHYNSLVHLLNWMVTRCSSDVEMDQTIRIYWNHQSYQQVKVLVRVR